MNKLSLPRLIVRTNCKKLIMPLVFLFVVLLLYFHTPVRDFVSYPTADSPKEAQKVFDEPHSYARINVKDLYYTGLEQYINGNTTGYFYYTLFEGEVYYILISDKQFHSEPSLYIDEYSCVVRLQKDPSLITRLSLHMSRELNWEPASLQAITCDVIFNQARLQRGFEYVFVLILLICVVLASIHIVIVLVSLIFPKLSLCALRLRRYSEGDMYQKACEQYANATPMAPSFYITEDFFIGYDKANIYIVPIKHIVWAYFFGTLNTRLFKTRLTYSFCVVTDKKKHFTLKQKKKEDAEYVLNALQARFPEIMIGIDGNHLF